MYVHEHKNTSYFLPLHGPRVKLMFLGLAARIDLLIQVIFKTYFKVFFFLYVIKGTVL